VLVFMDDILIYHKEHLRQVFNILSSRLGGVCGIFLIKRSLPCAYSYR
jgi:hypothetical protein